MHDFTTQTILAALEVSDQATLMFWVILALFAMVKAGESAVTIWHRTRKQPGAEETFATKKELGEYARRTDARLDLIDQEMNSGLEKLRTTVANEMGAVQRALGRLEGQIGQAISAASNNRKTT